MSETIVGVLEKKERAVTKGGINYFTLTVKGVKVSAWREKMSLVEGAREGETVEMTFTTNEKGFKNLDNLVIQTGSVPAVSDQVGGGGIAGPSARDAAVTLGGIGHDVAAILGGILAGKTAEELGPALAWSEENYPRITALYSKIGDELFTSRMSNLYGPQE